MGQIENRSEAIPVACLAQAGFFICIMVQRNRLWKSERQQVMAFLAMRGCKRRPQGNRPQKRVRQVIGRALRRSDEMASVAMRGCKRGQSPHQKFLDEIRQEREAKEAAKKKKEAAASIASSSASSSKSWMPKPKPSMVPKATMWPRFRGSVASCME